MPTHKHWRSTPFRISILNAAVTGLLIVLTALILYNRFHIYSRDRLEQLLTDEFEIMEAQYAKGGIDSLDSEVKDAIRAYATESRLYAIIDSSGTIITANTAQVPKFNGYAEFSSNAFGSHTTHNYIALSRQIDDYRLVVAIETLLFDQIRATLLVTLSWACLAVFAISILVGGIIGAGAARRLDNITDSIDRFAKGDVTARATLAGANDDIDDIAYKVNKKLDRIEGLVEAVNQAGAAVAHDLKTPLSRLYIDLQSMVEAIDDQDLLLKKIADAERQTQDIVSLFNSILMLSRIKNAKNTEKKEIVALDHLACDLVETYAVIAEEKNQSVVFEKCDEKPHHIWCERPLVTQMLVNLIENAIRHTPEGSRIALATASITNGVQLTVTDDGPGIPDDEREKVFRRFYRAEMSRSTEGSGIGMALVSAIVDQSGATIELDDAMPGLIVRISFPKPPKDAT